MWAKGNLEQVVITIDGEERTLLRYGEGWVQEGAHPSLHPLVAAMVWNLIEEVTNETIPPNSDAFLHRMLTTFQVYFSYSGNMPAAKVQKVMDRLIAEAKKA